MKYELITKTFKKPKRQISLTFKILQQVKPLHFSIPESGKKDPFRTDPPCIGHCRENPLGSITIFTCKAGGSAGGTSIDSVQTDCFGIPGCSRVFWMSFPQAECEQHTQQDELARRFHIHDQFFGKVTRQYNNRSGTLYDHRSLVSGSLPQEFKFDTAFF